VQIIIEIIKIGALVKQIRTQPDHQVGRSFVRIFSHDHSSDRIKSFSVPLHTTTPHDLEWTAPMHADSSDALA
jgi:hypothetical protein